MRAEAAHVFVDDVDAPVLRDADRHHVERVLRLRVGERISVSDGAGAVRMTVLGSGSVLEPVSEVERSPRPVPLISVGFALVKGDRPDWIVQKLTECGVDRIVPFVAARSVVRWDAEKAERHVERWRQIATEAAMQSRRAWLPEVATVAGFPEALAEVGGVIADAGGSSVASLFAADGAAAGVPRRVGLLVGPEGGWAPEERSAAGATVTLGAHVFRAETAAVAAGVLMAALRHGLVGSPAGA